MNDPVLSPLKEEDSTDGSSSFSSEEEMSLGELYKTLTVNEDIILVIDSDSEDTLRKGLIAMKYKANKVARDSGLDYDGRTMEFKILDWTNKEKEEDEDWDTKTKIQIYLKAKNAIKVHQLIITDKEF